MDRKEMSTLFDTLYNNITSNQAPGLNEYEKSVFLTKAQDEIIKNYFNPKGNKYQEGYDATAKRQADFSMLTVQSKESMAKSAAQPHFDPRSYLTNFPADIMFTINETVQIYNSDQTGVVAIRQIMPISFDEYTTLMSKPFKEPLKYQAWRLNTGTTTQTVGTVTTTLVKAEIIMTTDDIESYYFESVDLTKKCYPYYVLRYVKKPDPIILVDLTNAYGEDLAIHGQKLPSDCKLDPTIHEEIVQRAVELAKVAWSGDLNASLQAGQRSE